LTLGGIYYYSILTNKLDNVDQFLNAIDTTEYENDPFYTEIDSNTMAVVDSAALSTNDTLVNQQQEIAVPVVEEIQNHKYTIVIGTHPKIEQAQKEAAEYNNKGYKH